MQTLSYLDLKQTWPRWGELTDMGSRWNPSNRGEKFIDTISAWQGPLRVRQVIYGPSGWNSPLLALSFTSHHILLSYISWIYLLFYLYSKIDFYESNMSIFFNLRGKLDFCYWSLKLTGGTGLSWIEQKYYCYVYKNISVLKQVIFALFDLYLLWRGYTLNWASWNSFLRLQKEAWWPSG